MIAVPVVPLLETVHLTKSYAGNEVLSDVSVALGAGEVVSVIGENGAGKSTFAKIVTGVIAPDSGEVRLGGEALVLRSPRDALRKGIGLIPQELAYAPQLTVGENIVLGRWPGRLGWTSPSSIRRFAQAECERLGIELEVDRLMSSVKLADRQLVEIVKALSRLDRVVVLDEPTSSLSERESGRLFDVLKTMTAQGVGVLYISHRMDEVTRISNRVIVFRNGRLVGDNEAGSVTQATLIHQMLGELKDAVSFTSPPETSGELALRLRRWHSDQIPALGDFSLDLMRGEVVGLYGLRGSGVEGVAEGLAGLRPDMQGDILVGERVVHVFKTPRESQRFGIAYVPPERKRDGIVLGMSVQANLTLEIIDRLAKNGLIRPAAERRVASDLASQFDVRYRRLQQPIGELSGGNQQKVLLASRSAASPVCLVLHEPTRGVDVGARVEIHAFLNRLARAGTAVVVMTSDVDEAVAVADRLVIVRDGFTVAELSGAAKTRSAAVAAAAGGSN